MADLIYNSFKEYMADGTLDLDGDSFKACLLDDGHTPSAAHSQYSEVSGDELANGNGYTTGGATLGTVTWTRSGGTVTFDAADPSWTSATFTARYMVIYDDTHANDLLVCLFDFSSNQTVTNGTFTFQFDASGIFTLS